MKAMAISMCSAGPGSHYSCHYGESYQLSLTVSFTIENSFKHNYTAASFCLHTDHTPCSNNGMVLQQIQSVLLLAVSKQKGCEQQQAVCLSINTIHHLLFSPVPSLQSWLSCYYGNLQHHQLTLKTCRRHSEGSARCMSANIGIKERCTG